MLSHSRRSSEASYEEEDRHRSSMDALLDSKVGSESPSSHAFLNPPPASSSGAKLASLIALVFASAVSAYTTPDAAAQDRKTVLQLVHLQFVLLITIPAILGWLSPRGYFGRGGIGIGQGESAERRRALAVGGLTVLSAGLGLWEARWLSPRVWQAVEIAIIPTLFVLSLLPSLGINQLRTTSAAVACTSSVAFLVLFGLLGTSQPFIGLILVILRVIVDVLRWSFLKQGLTSERAGGFLLASSACALFTSLPLFIFGWAFLGSPTFVRTSLDILSMFAYAISAVICHIALCFALHTFASPLPIASHIIPRNAFLLALSTFGRDGVALVGSWQSTLLVLVAGSLAVGCTEPEVSVALKDWSRRIRLLGGSAHSGGGDAAGYDLENELDSRSPSPTASPTFVGVRRSSNGSARYLSSPSPSSFTLLLLPLLPLLTLLLQSSSSTTPSLRNGCNYLSPSLRPSLCPSPAISRNVDLVFAYFDEDLDKFAGYLAEIQKGTFVQERSSRVLVYNKGTKSEAEIKKALRLGSRDEVVPLPNLGREGATYLRHILLHYNSTLLANAGISPPPTSPPRSRILADHTFFLQPHFAWSHVSGPRMKLIEADTGFAALGPVLRTDCGEDGRGTGNYPFVKDLYAMFRGELCPPGGQLSAWSAAFVTSRKRIMANPYERYAALDELMEAPEGHWIHQLWGANGSGGPSNPALGHHVERAWPIIMGCTDPRIADECPDDVHVKEKCQCLDKKSS